MTCHRFLQRWWPTKQSSRPTRFLRSGTDIINVKEQRERVEVAALKFPSYFTLKSNPDERFRINLGHSYWHREHGILLSLELEIGDRVKEWLGYKDLAPMVLEEDIIGVWWARRNEDSRSSRREKQRGNNKLSLGMIGSVQIVAVNVQRSVQSVFVEHLESSRNLLREVQ